MKQEINLVWPNRAFPSWVWLIFMATGFYMLKVPSWESLPPKFAVDSEK